MQSRRVGRQEEREEADGLWRDCAGRTGGWEERLGRDHHSDCRAVACEFQLKFELRLGFRPEQTGKVGIRRRVFDCLEDELRGQDEGQGVG